MGTQKTSKLLDSAKNLQQMQYKPASERVIQKTAVATGDLIGNKIADKITTVSKKSLKELHSKETNNEIPKEKIYISRRKTTSY